jgi:hypothetical protein
VRRLVVAQGVPCATTACGSAGVSLALHVVPVVSDDADDRSADIAAEWLAEQDLVEALDRAAIHHPTYSGAPPCPT